MEKINKPYYPVSSYHKQVIQKKWNHFKFATAIPMGFKQHMIDNVAYANRHGARWSDEDFKILKEIFEIYGFNLDNLFLICFHLERSPMAIIRKLHETGNSGVVQEIVKDIK